MTIQDASTRVPDDWEIQISIQPDLVQFVAIAPDDETFVFPSLEAAVEFVARK